jgi:DNA-directed RNA polymerase subunit RPC12/RpoP
VSKHDSQQEQKDKRNARYALKYRQYKCRDCKHRTIHATITNKGPRCRMCGGKLKFRLPAPKLG